MKRYIKVLDIIEIKYASEPGKVYRVNVKESVEKGTLRQYFFFYLFIYQTDTYIH